MLYIFGYYIFGYEVPTGNVITENVINSSDNFYFENNIVFRFSRSLCVDNSYITGLRSTNVCHSAMSNTFKNSIAFVIHFIDERFLLKQPYLTDFIIYILSNFSSVNVFIYES